MKACIGPCGKRLCFKRTKNMHHKHCCFSLVFDYWASPVVHLLLLKGSRSLSHSTKLRQKVEVQIIILSKFFSNSLELTCNEIRGRSSGTEFIVFELANQFTLKWRQICSLTNGPSKATMYCLLRNRVVFFCRKIKSLILNTRRLGPFHKTFCLRPMTKGPINYLSCSGHLVNLLLGCPS